MGSRVAEFIEDGHKIHFWWDRDKLHIKRVECPHQGATGMCNRLRDYCAVARYIGVYSSELNVGSTPVDGPVEIAWLPIPGESDLDKEFAQIWVVPVNDIEYMQAKSDLDYD
jgi:hypothetical protein